MGGDANLVSLALQAAFEHVADLKVLAHLAHIDGLALINSRRIAGDDVEIRESGKVGDDIFGETVREPTRCLISTDIFERKYGDRGLACGWRFVRLRIPCLKRFSCECFRLIREQEEALLG